MKKWILFLAILCLPLWAFSQPSIAGFTYLGTFAGHSYYYSNDFMTWSEAQVACHATGNGGELSSVTSIEETNWLMSILPGYPFAEYWLGANDSTLEGTFVWSNGEPFGDYTNWDTGAPFGTPVNGHDYVAFEVINGMWYDYPTSNSFQALLEVPAIILPVEMTSFTASGGDQSVTLNWQTASETNNDHFNLYRSTLATSSWELIARVAGHGTSATVNSYQFADTRLTNGLTYRYQIADVSVDGIERLHRNIVTATPLARARTPINFELAANYPNPFNPTTRIAYQTVTVGHVKLQVFDPLGRLVTTLVDQDQVPNCYEVNFDGTGLPSGDYLIRLQSGKQVSVRHMQLQK